MKFRILKTRFDSDLPFALQYEVETDLAEVGLVHEEKPVEASCWVTYGRFETEADCRWMAAELQKLSYSETVDEFEGGLRTTRP